MSSLSFRARYVYLTQRVLCLVSLMLCVSLAPARHSTAESRPTPIAAPRTLVSTCQPTAQHQLQAAIAAENPVATAFIKAIPSTDGSEVRIVAAGVRAASSAVVLSIDPGSGPSSHEGSYTMTISQGLYLATAIGFTPQNDIGVEGDDTMSITTTVNNATFSTGPLNFERAFIEPTQPEEISVNDGDFKVHLPNLGSVPANTYVVVMSTNAPPEELPPGYGFASRSYDLSPSGALTQTQKLMTLDFCIPAALPGGAAAHTLAIAGWDPVAEKWLVLGGNYSDTSGRVTLAVRQFGIYALVTTPNWRDSFRGTALTGVAARVNTERDSGDAIVLSSGAQSGLITTIPISPTLGATRWGTLHYSATLAPGTAVVVDVLDQQDQVVRQHVTSATNLNQLTVAAYPRLKLRATLTAEQAGQTPRLHEWSLGWTSGDLPSKVYLPIATTAAEKTGGNDASQTAPAALH